MTTLKNSFAFIICCLLSLCFTQSYVQATTTLPHFIGFDFGTHANNYEIRKVAASPTDGEHVFAIHKRSGTQLVLEAKDGKIVKLFSISKPTAGAGGGPRVRVFDGNTGASATCNSRALCLNFQTQKCFTTPWGDCFCVCGAWFAPDR